MPKNTSNRLTPAVATLAAAAMALSLTACGGTSDTASQESDGTLTIYSGRNEEFVGPLLAEFVDQTGINVEVR